MLLTKLDQLKRSPREPALTIVLDTHLPKDGSEESATEALRRFNPEQILERATTCFPEGVADGTKSQLLKQLEELLGMVQRKRLSEGLCICVGEGQRHWMHLPYAPDEESFTFSKGFRVRPVLHRLQRMFNYVVLVLSPKKTRIFEGLNAHTLEFNLPGLPRGIEPPSKSVSFARKAGRQQESVFGLSKTVKDTDSRRRSKTYIKEVESVLLPLIQQASLPCVIVANDKLLNEYREHAEEPEAIRAFVNGSYDYASPRELSQLVWPIVQHERTLIHRDLQYEIEGAEVQEQLEIGLKDAWEATVDDRAHKLVVEEDYHKAAELIDDMQSLKLRSMDESAPTYLPDAVDYLIELVRDTNGDVYYLPKDSLKDKKRLVLITAY
ncbi:MAG: hypothetical protein ACOCZ8_03815 [Bacteroidota bacterium]